MPVRWVDDVVDTLNGLMESGGFTSGLEVISLFCYGIKFVTLFVSRVFRARKSSASHYSCA